MVVPCNWLARRRLCGDHLLSISVTVQKHRPYRREKQYAQSYILFFNIGAVGFNLDLF